MRPCGAHTAASWLWSLAFVAVAYVSKYALMRLRFQRIISASFLIVVCRFVNHSGWGSGLGCFTQENHRTWGLEGFNNRQIINNETLGPFGGVLANTRWQERIFGQCPDLNFRSFGATWSIWSANLAPTGFGRADPLGVSRCIWRNRRN